MIGTTIKDRYRLESSLGKGGFGEAFDAVDLNENRPVVVKVGKAEAARQKPELVLLYNREAITLMELQHDHIVRLLDFGEDAGNFFMVMESDNGISLNKYLTGYQWPTIPEVVHLISQVAAALHYVHARRIVHQDLKPSNLILRDGKIDHCKIVDFGCAVLKRMTQLHQARKIMGTFPYISPEQLGAYQGEVDARSDLYALGVMFYELLSGSWPFAEGTTAKEIRSGTFGEVKIPSLINPLVPAILDRIAMKLISHDPAERYFSAESLLEDLAQYQKLSRTSAGSPFFRIGKTDDKRDLAFHVPFVGRGKELNSMLRRFEHVLHEHGGIILLEGQTGSGKTRLLEEFSLHARVLGGVCLPAKCNDNSTNYPYFPLVQIFQEYMEYLTTLSKENAKKHHALIRELFSMFHTEISDMAPTMTRYLDKSQAGGPTDQAARLPQFLERIGQFFATVGSDLRPLLLVFEDVHWADPGTFRLLTSFAATLTKKPGVLAVASYRPEEVDDRPELQAYLKQMENQPGTKVVRVSPFTPQKAWELVAAILPRQTEGHRDLVRLLFEFSRGNPLFILEMIRELIMDGVLVRHNDSWTIDRERVRRPVVPKSLVDIIMARIKHLSPVASDILHIASCIGRSFPRALLQELVPAPEGEFDAALDEALRNRLLTVRSGGEAKEFTFTHDKIYEIFYQNQDQQQRERLHLQIAEVLENQYRADLQPVVYSLAYHFARGGNHAKAFDYAVIAGEKAESALALHQAVEFFDQAISLINHVEPERARKLERGLRMRLADASSIIGEYDRAIDNYQTLLEATEDKWSRAALERKIGNVYFRRGAMPTAIDHFSNSMRHLKGNVAKTRVGAIFVAIFYAWRYGMILPIPSRLLRWGSKSRLVTIRELVHLNHQESFMLFWVDCVRSIELVMKNHYLTRILGRSPELAVSWGQIAVVLAMQGLNRTSRWCLNRGMRLSHQTGSQFALGTNLFYRGLIQMWAGRNKQAIATLNKALAVHEAIDANLEKSIEYTTIAQCLCKLGQIDEACDMTTNFKEMAELVKDVRGQADAYLHLAEYFYYYGNLEDARQNIALCFACIDQNINPLLYVLGKGVQARIELVEGKIDQAIATLEDSVRVAKGKMFSGEYVLINYVTLGEAYLKKVTTDDDLDPREKKRALSRVKQMLRFCQRNAKFFRNYLGPTLRLKAQLNSHLGNDRAAEKYFEKAVEVLREHELKYDLAITMLSFADYLEAWENKKGRAIDAASPEKNEVAWRIEKLRADAGELLVECNIRRHFGAAQVRTGDFGQLTPEAKTTYGLRGSDPFLDTEEEEKPTNKMH